VTRARKRLILGAAIIVILASVTYVALLVGSKPDPSRQAASAANEISQQISQIDMNLIRNPSPDEVRREEFTSLPGLDFSAVSIPQETIRELLNSEKERLISGYIEEEVRPRIEKFTQKWGNELVGFGGLDQSQMMTKATDLDRDLASVESIDSRFQTAVLKARLQKIRDQVERIQMVLAGIDPPARQNKRE
jgi:hypothetical protein